MKLTKLLILAAALLVLTGAGVYGLRRIADPVRAASQSSGGPVVRLVKNPQPAPAFSLRDLSGNVVSSSGFGGKVVLLNFWATWCTPCRKEIPELIALQKAYQGRLQIIGFSEDDDPPEKVLQFARKQGINYPVVMATENLIKAYGGVPALPTTFILDTSGRVVQKHTGLYPSDAYALELGVLTGASSDARVERFEDTGQVFLENAAKATELPGVDFSGLTPAQRKVALHRLNAESCTCGCGLTVAECRINDSACPVSIGLAAKVVSEVAHAGGSHPAPPTKPGTT